MTRLRFEIWERRSHGKGPGHLHSDSPSVPSLVWNLLKDLSEPNVNRVRGIEF